MWLLVPLPLWRTQTSDYAGTVFPDLVLIEMQSLETVGHDPAPVGMIQN